MKQRIQRIITGTVLLAAVGWAVYGVDFGVVLTSWENAKLWGALVVLALASMDLVMRAMAWRWAIKPIKQAPLVHVLSSYLIGMFSNVFLPFKLGDFAGSHYLGRREHISETSALSALEIQRVFEGLTLLLVIGLVGVLFSYPFLVKRNAILFSAFILSVVAGMYVVVGARRRILRWVESFLRRYGRGRSRRLLTILRALFRGADALHDTRAVAAIVSVLLGSWAVQIVMVMTMADALHIELDVLPAAIVLVIINIGITVPLSPGNVGTYQALCVLGLSLFDVGKSRALSFGILFQFIQQLPVVIGGGLSLLGETVGPERAEHRQPKKHAARHRQQLRKPRRTS